MTVERPVLWATTSNNRLNPLQHVRALLKNTGLADRTLKPRTRTGRPSRERTSSSSQPMSLTTGPGARYFRPTGPQLQGDQGGLHRPDPGGDSQHRCPQRGGGAVLLDEAETVNALVPQLREEGIEAIVVLLHQGAPPTAARTTAGPAWRARSRRSLRGWIQRWTLW